VKLSGSDKTMWRRLEKAQEVLTRMFEGGIIDGAVVEAVDARTARLSLLLQADNASVSIGGSRSEALRDEIKKLSSVMVQLIDAAVEHEAAAIDAADYVPVQMADLRDALEAHAKGMREIKDLGTNWH